MNKQEFLTLLRNKLSGLPQNDIDERLNFYSEMIEDRMEEGLSEEEAVAAAGSVEEIVAQILSDIPLVKIAKEKVKPKRRLSALEVVLLVVGSPVWLSLLIAVFAVIFSLYVALWAIVICLWATFVSIAACALCGIVVGVAFALGINKLTGIALIGSGILCAGLAIFLFYGCKAATKGTALLAKKMVLGMKRCFVKKECA